MLTQPVPYFHLKLTLSDSRTIQFSRTCWAPSLPCSTVCWLCIRPLKFYLLQYLMQYVLRVFCYSWVFQVLCFTWRFSFVSIWKRLKGNVSSHEWIWGPFWCQAEANDTLTEGKLKHSIVTCSIAVCLLCVVLDASPQEYTECWEWVNCTKNPVLHWMLFNCCFSRSLMQVHQAVILCFVFGFFNYLRSSSSRLVLFQLSCSLMPIKTNLTKKCLFHAAFFFLRPCKASWETPVKVDVYTTVVWLDSLWELIV